MFNIESFREYLETRIDSSNITKEVKDLILVAIGQFDVPPESLVPYSKSWLSKKLKIAFPHVQKIWSKSCIVYTLLFEFGYKWCYRCNEILPIDNYYRSKDRPDGYMHRCKPCDDLLDKYKKARRRGHGRVDLRILVLFEEAIALQKSTKIEHHVDHFVPLCLGGRSEYNNMRVIPATENRAKSGTHPKDFYGEERYNEILYELNNRM